MLGYRGVPTRQGLLYSDSKVALGYIKNCTRQFYIYVANRVQQIRRLTRPEQWLYVPMHLNPADSRTRAIPADQVAESGWLCGPDILHSSQSLTDMTSEMSEFVLPEDDAEVRPDVTTLMTKVNTDSLGSTRFTRFSKWTSLVKAIARLIRAASTLAGAKRGRSHHDGLDADDLRRAEDLIIREVQHDSFTDEISALQKSLQPSKNSAIAKLDPYIDTKGLLRVGGHLRLSKLEPDERHPLILQRSHPVATLLVRHYHETVMHQGRHLTEGTIQ